MSCSVRAVTTTPMALQLSNVTQSNCNISFPRYYGGSTTILALTRPAQCSLRATARTVSDSLIEAFSLNTYAYSLPPKRLQSDSGRSNS